VTARGAAVTKIEVKAKQQRCLDLAVKGLTYAEIAEAEGYASESGARKAVNAALKRSAKKAAETVRPLMVARAEKLWEHGLGVMLEGRDEGDMERFAKGASVADKALARLMRLHGLDTPDVSVQIGAGAGELERLKNDFMLEINKAAGGVLDAELVEPEPGG
jgi:DNA-binding CsgD family transcriptional regulator